MTQKIQAKTKSNVATAPPKMIRAILEELRLLRNGVMLLFPQENIKEYAHSNRIKRSYQKATQKYPPVSLCK